MMIRCRDVKIEGEVIRRRLLCCPLLGLESLGQQRAATWAIVCGGRLWIGPVIVAARHDQLARLVRARRRRISLRGERGANDWRGNMRGRRRGRRGTRNRNGDGEGNGDISNGRLHHRKRLSSYREGLDGMNVMNGRCHWHDRGGQRGEQLRWV
jgi:hypothetical protein